MWPETLIHFFACAFVMPGVLLLTAAIRSALEAVVEARRRHSEPPSAHAGMGRRHPALSRA